MAKCEDCGKYTPFAFCDFCTYRDPLKFQTDDETFKRPRLAFRDARERKLYQELMREQGRDARASKRSDLGSGGLCGDVGDKPGNA